jgi:dimethylaniline monooxygenase (N-oxide forming)
MSRTTPWSRLGTALPSPSYDVKTVCVIGAGSSGLVAAKHLREAGYDVTVYERTDSLGGAFLHKSYDDARLVSSKYLTSFSDLRPAVSDPPHLSLAQYMDYLRKYAEEMDLEELITFGAHVASIDRDGARGHGYVVRVEPAAKQSTTPAAATTSKTAPNPRGPTGSSRPGASTSPPKRRGRSPSPARPSTARKSGGRGGGRGRGGQLRAARTEAFDAVCVCSGLHEAAYTPHISGLDGFDGEWLHSSQYKDKSSLEGKRVLVVGCGETGMDLAYRAVQVAERVALSIRRGFLSVPHEGWAGVPLDTLIANLFEHSYEHWWCHRHHIKWKATTLVIRLGFFLATGSSVGYNQWVGRVENVKRGHHILCKSTAAMPHLNLEAKRKSWRRFLWWWAEKRVEKPIEPHPAPERVRGKTVTFSDGSTFDADVILMATGYRQTFPFLPPHLLSSGDATATATAVASKAGEASKAPGASAKAKSSAGGDVDSSSSSSSSSSSGHGWWTGMRGTGARGEEDPLPSEHYIVNPDEPTLSFIGFVRPNVGAIPPMAELQTMWWIQRLKGRVSRGEQPPSYGLIGRKLAYGVDYGNVRATRTPNRRTPRRTPPPPPRHAHSLPSSDALRARDVRMRGPRCVACSTCTSWRQRLAPRRVRRRCSGARLVPSSRMRLAKHTRRSFGSKVPSSLSTRGTRPRRSCMSPLSRAACSQT